MIAGLGFIGYHGRWCLIAGLIAGFAFPELAQIIKAWLPALIFLLLMVSACRIGPMAVVRGHGAIGGSIGRVLAYQLAAPLLALAVLYAAGWTESLFGIALVLALAAPSISGAPNFSIMIGKDPTRAMRLLLIGTALFPLTVIPVYLALPAIPTLADVVASAVTLFAVIAVAVGCGFILRRDTELSAENQFALDGIAALLLGVLVIGLMAAVGPALRETPLELLTWVLFACAVNFGSQIIAYRADPSRDAGSSIVAGNRNIALFLVALPAELTDSLLLFIGCYQVPMYLTPLVMARLYRSGR